MSNYIIINNETSYFGLAESLRQIERDFGIDHSYLSRMIKKKEPKDFYYYLSKKGDLKEAAKNLYTTLRKIKKDNFKSLAVEKIKNHGLGKTINDRLLRASKFNEQ